MKSSLLLLLLAFRTAQPGYQYEFPRDHFNHPDFKTEWWYYTGNLKAADGHRFGFELTFFRSAADREPSTNPWAVPDIWMAHLALSDIDGQKFRHTQRMNRTGPGLAGSSLEQRRVWNGNWQVQWTGEKQHLQAIAEEFSLSLDLTPLKPPVIHGVNGISQKSPGAGRASHYISFPRLATSGTVTIEGQPYTVQGATWMDHEFFSHSLDANQAGWDWISLQFDDNSELMLYQLRRTDGSPDPFSAGTYIDAQGRARHLKREDFTLAPGTQRWTSPESKAAYPLEWNLAVPSLKLNVTLATPLKSQELTSKVPWAPIYWEGAITAQGTHRGSGYLEMTGYAAPVKLQ